VRIESPAFTEREMRGFLDEFVNYERLRLADRLEAASQRLAELVQRGLVEGHDGQAEWSGQEVLAHIVVLSKFYGVLTSRVGSGKLSQLDLLPPGPGSRCRW
jgi:hypothetical protein